MFLLKVSSIASTYNNHFISIWKLRKISFWLSVFNNFLRPHLPFICQIHKHLHSNFLEIMSIFYLSHFLILRSNHSIKENGTNCNKKVRKFHFRTYYFIIYITSHFGENFIEKTLIKCFWQVEKLAQILFTITRQRFN